ncbi:hypothetical protein [Marinobacterium aestuariivivens]|uniref:Transposase n=1 Tax=Marinobacterium aestuariivivens TaxID=1698799 RepID=A0ABW2A980_9GAMM
MRKLLNSGICRNRCHAAIRRFALNLLRQAKGSKPGIKNKRLRAAYDDAFRASVLQLTPRVH